MSIASTATLSFYNGTMDYVNITNSGTVNLGKNDGNISNTIPRIEHLGEYDTNKFTSTGEFNFYDGKITYWNKLPVTGTINNIPANSSVLYTIDGSKHIYTLTTDPVAQIDEGGSIQQFSTLEAAFAYITTSNHTQIDLLQNIAIIEGHEFTIDSTKDITLNINGKKIYGTGKINPFFTNEGKFEITDTTGGSITTFGEGMIDNTGTLKISKGSLSVEENTNSRSVINNTGTGTVEVTGGTFNIKGHGIYGSTADLRGYAVKVDNSDTNNKPTVEIGGNVSIPDGTARSAFKINNAIFKITGGELSPTDKIYSAGYVNSITNSTITITGGTISGATYIDASSTANISGAQTTVGEFINNGIVTATTRATFNGTFTNRNNATFENVTITASSTSAISVEGGTVTDIKAGTVIEQTSDANNSQAISINSYGKCTILGDVEITSTYGTGIKNQGVLTLGDNQAPVSTVKPAITGATYGINNTGTFNFYDGLITGTGNRALTGNNPAALPTDYAVQISDDAKVAWLESSASSTNVAEVNGARYKSLQSAINATSSGTITILSRIALTEPITITAGKNLVIDLKGYSIEYDGTDAAVTNNGTLTIIDSDEDGTSTQNYGIVENKVGPAIQNNGTLTIGSDADSAVYTNSPRIVGGTYAVVNSSSATFKFYDGILKGVTAAVDGTITNTTSISGYTLTDGTEVDGGVTYHTKYYN